MEYFEEEIDYYDNDYIEPINMMIPMDQLNPVNTIETVETMPAPLKPGQRRVGFGPYLGPVEQRRKKIMKQPMQIQLQLPDELMEAIEETKKAKTHPKEMVQIIEVEKKDPNGGVVSTTPAALSTTTAAAEVPSTSPAPAKGGKKKG